MAISINRDFVSTKNTYTGQNNPKYIVIHETDNFAKGAGARRHAEAQAAGHLSTSVQYYAGSDGIYQAARHTDGTYSVGREYGGDHSVKDATNRNTINIEICVTEDGDYAKARQNAIELVKHLMAETGIPAGRVIRHFDAKGKYCPRKMMDNPALWEKFKAQIQGKAPAAKPETQRPEEKPDVQQGKVRGIVTTQTDPLNIRETPGVEGKKIGTIPKGAAVEVLEQGKDWHKVRYDGCVGYSAAKYISIVNNDLQEKKVAYVAACTGDGVRVRATPEFGDNVIRKLNKGNLFDVLDVRGVWTHIRVVDKEGYIYSEYVGNA